MVVYYGTFVIIGKAISRCFSSTAPHSEHTCSLFLVMFLNMGQSRSLFRLFLSFSHSNYSFNFSNVHSKMVCLGVKPGEGGARSLISIDETVEPGLGPPNNNSCNVTHWSALWLQNFRLNGRSEYRSATTYTS